MSEHNPEKLDRRVQRSQQQLQQALIALTLERGYEAITIRDITERAQVGYATFFRHYSDKQALLGDVLFAMKDEFLLLLASQSIATDPEHTGALIFDYVRQNADMARVLLQSTDMLTLLHTVYAIGEQDAAPLFSARPDAPVPLPLAIDHLMSALIMLIRWWLDHDMPYPPDQMGAIAARLIIRPVIESFV